MRLKFGLLTLFFGSLMVIIAVGFGGVIRPNTDCVFSQNTEEFCITIDPGHGGFDGGAVAVDGTCEKDINLAIALELKEILKEYPVDLTMIRESDTALGKSKEEDLKTRKSIIEESKADLTISIHLNSYPYDASVYGAQIFYPSWEQKRTDEDTYENMSKSYADNVQKNLEINISDGRERVAMAKNDTYLMRNIKTPFILVECGFLSNINECNMLKKAEYQRLIAECIWEGINTTLQLKKEQKIQIIQSANK